MIIVKRNIKVLPVVPVWANIADDAIFLPIDDIASPLDLIKLPLADINEPLPLIKCPFNAIIPPLIAFAACSNVLNIDFFNVQKSKDIFE